MRNEELAAGRYVFGLIRLRAILFLSEGMRNEEWKTKPPAGTYPFTPDML
jgi:hypothetical protein